MDQKPNQTPKRFDQNQNRSDGPNRNQNQNGGQNNNNNRSQFQRYLPLLIIAVLFTLLLNSIATRLQGSRYEEITYDAFLQMVDDGDVSKVIFESDQMCIRDRRSSRSIFIASPPNVILHFRWRHLNGA